MKDHKWYTTSRNNFLRICGEYDVLMKSTFGSGIVIRILSVPAALLHCRQ